MAPHRGKSKCKGPEERICFVSWRSRRLVQGAGGGAEVREVSKAGSNGVVRICCGCGDGTVDAFCKASLADEN